MAKKEEREVLTVAQKERICEAVRQYRYAHFESDVSMANFLDIHVTIYSRVFGKGHELNKVLSAEVWLSIAVYLGVDLHTDFSITAARTETFEFITDQLDLCRESMANAVLCDKAGIGKTFAARFYASQNAHVAYIDCTQCKAKKELMREICRCFGLSGKGTYSECYKRFKLFVRTFEMPLIILDEAADLHYSAFSELKTLINGTERVCSWYLMGASGLKPKINQYLADTKLGAEEVFRRIGDKYQRILTEDLSTAEIADFLRKQVKAVALTNGKSEADAQQLMLKDGMTLSRLEILLKKEYKKRK